MPLKTFNKILAGEIKKAICVACTVAYVNVCRVCVLRSIERFNDGKFQEACVRSEQIRTTLRRIGQFMHVLNRLNMCPRIGTKALQTMTNKTMSIC